jgi:outer membrane protein TolC
LVLDAVKEASDAISSSQSLARQHSDPTRSLEAAEAVYRIQRDRFQAGMSNQLALLNAETALLAQQRARTDVRARELDNRVALMKSLGGGWRAER